jgi:hypothetical protein
MKTSLGRFAAWRLALGAPRRVRPRTDIEAQNRWEGEGGTTRIPPQHKRGADEPKEATKS